MQENVKILLLGDKGTGKSSIISSYVSRHFPEELPALIKDAVIPPDTTGNNVAVIIMDSSAEMSDREVLLEKIRISDSIILVYDVTRIETIDSLVQVWLPTIRDIFNDESGLKRKAVLVVGNKKDLGEDQDLNPMNSEKEVMIKILEDFPFVMAFYKCSAKRVEVDHIFYQSELAVTFPLWPLFDNSNSEFTVPCKLAFLRIFRCFDSNQDGLWKDDELCMFQQKSFGEPLKEEDVLSLKKSVPPEGLRNGLISFEGLMGILRLFVDRGQQQTLWLILDEFGYTIEEFGLELTCEIEEVPQLITGERLELSIDAFQFLYDLAVNARLRREYAPRQNRNPAIPPHNLQKNILTSSNTFLSKTNERIVQPFKELLNDITLHDLDDIFSVIPDATHPWSSPPLCQDDYDQTIHLFLLSEGRMRLSSDASPSVTSSVQGVAGTPLPSQTDQSEVSAINISTSDIDSSNIKRDEVFCSVGAWMAQWQMLAVHRPALVQNLLFRLGYIKQNDFGLSIISMPQAIPAGVINVCLLGAKGVGKADLVRVMSGLTYTSTDNSSHNLPDQDEGSSGDKSRSSISSSAPNYHLRVIRAGCDVKSDEIGELPPMFIHGSSSQRRGSVRQYKCLVFTAVPYDQAEDWIKTNAAAYDVAVLVIDSGEGLRKDERMPAVRSSEDMNVSSGVQKSSIIPGKEDYDIEAQQRNEQNVIPSFSSAQHLEALLPATLPRLYVANRSDLLTFEKERKTHSSLLPAVDHLKTHDLPALLPASSVTGEGINDLKTAMLDIAYQPELGIPFFLRKKHQRLYVIWVAAAVCLLGGLAVYLNKEKKESGRYDMSGGLFRWIPGLYKPSVSLLKE